MLETNEKKSISAKQLTYSVALYIIGSNMLTNSTFDYTKNQSWMSVLIAAAVGAVLVVIYGKIAANHPGSSLFDINGAVFGTVGGKIVSAVYVFFFLTLAVFNTQDLGSFVHTFVLPTTPLNMTYLAFMVICVYAVRKGAEKMTQYGTFILFLYIALLLILTALLVPKIHPENFLPVFSVPLKNVLLSAHTVAMLPFGEIFVFLMMTQFVQKPADVGSALKRGLMIGAATIFVLVSRDIAVMGQYARYSTSPTFSTIRLIDIGDILTRLEIINASIQIILLFFKVSILLYALTAGIGHLFNIERYNIFTLISGALVIVCANFFFSSSSEHTEWFRAAATYATFFLFVLPLATLIASEIKKIRAAKASASSPQQQ